MEICAMLTALPKTSSGENKEQHCFFLSQLFLYISLYIFYMYVYIHLIYIYYM